MHIVYILFILNTVNGHDSLTTMRFSTEGACQQAAAFLINEGQATTAYCVKDADIDN